MSEINIAYLDVAEFEEGNILRGGALVTDRTTEPLEFRCTSAVRPTALQRILWGARLDGHVAANLVGLPLLRKLTQQYGLVVVQNRDFLEVRTSIEVPVILLSRDTSIVFDQPDTRTNAEWGKDLAEGKPHQGQTSEALLTSTAGRFEPVVLECHPAFQEDRQAARETLAPVFGQRDVVEPFDRIAAALQAVHEQKVGD